MELETQKRLQGSLDQVVEHLCRMSGTKTYEDAIAALRVQFRDKNTSPAAWIHRIAREAYPTNEPDSVRPEYFYEILGLIDTRQKANAVLASLPQDATPQIERFLKFLLKEFLPNQRRAAQEFVKQLPQRRSGGAPSKMPSQAECLEICNEISKLHAAGVLLGTAQQRAAKKWNKSVRVIQRIWAERGPKTRR
jgi:hypothetical protein